MYSIAELKKILVLDIETSSNYINYADFSKERPGELKFWQKKARILRKDIHELHDKSDADIYEQYAALYPEYGRVVVISIGQMKFDEDDNVSFLKKSFYGADELTVISEFINFIRGVFNKVPDMKIIGHDLKRFDIPYILKKALLLNIKVPTKLQLHKIKPWESCLLDTMEIWKSGNYSGAIALEHLTHLLGVSNPKEADICREEYGGVARAFWQGRIEELKDYCEEDIKATANVLLKFSNLNTITENVEINKS